MTGRTEKQRELDNVPSWASTPQEQPYGVEGKKESLEAVGGLFTQGYLAMFLLPLFDFKYFTQTLNWFMQNLLLLICGIVLFKKHTTNSKKNFFKVRHFLSSLSVKQCPYLLNNNVELNLLSIICMKLGCYSLMCLDVNKMLATKPKSPTIAH